MTSPTTTDPHRLLAWFLGPKAENAGVFEGLLLQVFRDYAHWRKNYFPADPILVRKSLRAALEPEHDLLEAHLADLLALLRRNFPFYSPRYVAHELSDTTMASMLGYFAGMLYNPNNVTPEAAPVTTELEIEVTTAILKMLGFRPPPGLPEGNEAPAAFYQRHGRSEFGWAHLTSGGTVANIEALWVARQVRYFPLAVKHTLSELKLDLTIKLPGDREAAGRSISAVDDYRLLLLRPNESVYLLGRFLDLLSRERVIHRSKSLFQEGWALLSKSDFCTTRGTGPAFTRYPPAVLVAGSRHYSIGKAASVIGLGPSSIVSIDMDESFHIDLRHLRAELLRLIREERVPLCVIASAGTTEEGAVDPIHRIVDLRAELESEHNASFWLHVDAAWGGYLRSLFSMEPLDETEALACKVSRLVGIPAPEIGTEPHSRNIIRWHGDFSGHVLEAGALAERRMAEAAAATPGIGSDELDPRDHSDRSPDDEAKFQRWLHQSELKRMEELLADGNHLEYARSMRALQDRLVPRGWLPAITAKPQDEFEIDLNSRIDWLSRFVRDQLHLKRAITINWPDKEVASSFLAFSKADSITVDPHKMGYAPYPSGCIAFRNDRVRSFILQEAPYITATSYDPLLHMPPRHSSLDERREGRRVVTESFSPYILEGSRPGAAASSLWLAMRMAPYVPRGHGMLARSSLLAARELYELLTRWADWCRDTETDAAYEFVSLTPRAPDTNLVTFVVKPRASNTLASMNALTMAVYETFSIQAELGEREHSYNQPFFLSRTTAKPPQYPLKGIKPFLGRAGLNSRAGKDFAREGIVVLRAAVMNPYIQPARKLAMQNFCTQFVHELARASSVAINSKRT